ncbi:MAG: dienelactone hydrolase family protein [Blastocatellia bacterium]
MVSETEIITGKAKFTGNGLEVDAFVARPNAGRPEGGEKAPVVIIVHEWWGLNPHIEDVAQRFADEGFLAVAVDLYEGKTTKDAREASRLMNKLRPEDGLARLQVVLDQSRANPQVASVGVTGFCMGGTFALLLACNARLEAAAPFYGDVPVDTTLIGKLSCPILFIGAEKDQWITTEKMNRLDVALKQYGKEGEVRIYKGADHAFFNDTRPEVYSRADAEDAWRSVIEFFNKHLRKGQAATA